LGTARRIKANVLNGVVIDIESDPDNPAAVQIQDLYDPVRLRSPVRRIQRKRRIGIDALHELAFLIAARLMSDRFFQAERLIGADC